MAARTQSAGRWLGLWVLWASAPVSCATEPPASAPLGCAWYQRCGVAPDGTACGTCDDGDPCTEDRCIGAAACTHLAVSDECACAPSCVSSEPRLVTVQHLRQGDGGLEGLDGPSAIAATADGRHVYVGSTRSASVALFAAGGTELGGYAPAQRIETGSVRALALAGDERWLVVASSDGLHVFGRDLPTGALTAQGVSPGPYDGVAAARSVVVAMTGDQLVVLDLTNGESRAVRRPELRGARALVFDRAGAHLYAAVYDSSQLVVLDATSPDWPVIDAETGGAGLDHPDALTLVGDESRLAVAGYCDSAVGLFQRAADGTLARTGAFAPDPPLTQCDTDYTTTGLSHPGALLPVGPDGLAVVSARADPFTLDFFRVTATGLEDRVRAPGGPPIFDAGQNEFVTESVPSTGPPTPTAFRGLAAAARSADRLFVATGVTNAVGVLPAEPGAAHNLR